MKNQIRHSMIKPYALLSIFVFVMSSFSANAIGHKKQYANPDTEHHNLNARENQHTEMQKRLQRLAKKLDLSQGQRSEMKVIFASMKIKRSAHKDALSGFKTQVQSLLKTAEFDESQFATIYVDHQLTFQKLAMDKAKVRHKMMQILNPEQQQKFLTMRH